MNRHRIKIALLLFAAAGMALCLTGCRMKTHAVGGSLSGISYEHAEKYSVGAAELSDAVECIDISWPVGTVTVMTHGASTVSFAEKSAEELTDDARLRYWLDGTTLRIRLCRNGQWQLEGLKKDLTVMVPEDVKLSGLHIGSVSAAIALDAVRTESADIHTTSGSVRLTDCAVTERMIFRSVSGGLDARLAQPLASFQSGTTSGACRLSAPSVAFFHADSVSGRVDLSAAGVPERLEIGTVSGNVGLALPQDASFSLDYASTSGDLSSDLPYTMKEGQYCFGGGTGAFGIVTVSGDIRITPRDGTTQEK